MGVGCCVVGDEAGTEGFGCLMYQEVGTFLVLYKVVKRVEGYLMGIRMILSSKTRQDIHMQQHDEMPTCSAKTGKTR